MFEVAIENADEAVRVLGGMPQPATERWCGIALLKTMEKEQQSRKRDWSQTPLPTQAGIRCNDERFAEFVTFRLRNEGRELKPETYYERAANYVREWCGIKSRADLLPGSEAADKWKQLDDAYYAWQRGYA